ncbi:uncharacterized protein LOC143555149 [Bidens hawaiensis]|uniref:uncharacterized protein LOC143555149 n=1 Tax=Bidens hawaiensis TaxID=980011 RepID=UPI00404AA740
MYYWLLVSGTVKGKSSLFHILNVYSPQNLVTKRALWREIRDLIGEGNGRWIVAGDFNSVRCAEDRRNSLFNVGLCVLDWNLTMGDGPRGVEIFPDHFQASTSGMETPPQSTSPSVSSTRNEEHSSSSRLWARRRFKSAATILNLLSPRRISWVKDTGGKEKVVLSSTEVKSLQAELADLEEREDQLRAKLEHIDEILRSCLLSGYLYMRTRWETLPGEPLPLDDTEVDDWVLRFVVLHGPCIYLYYVCTDLSPQDSTLLSDITEVGPMPHVIQEDGETRYYFYIVTRFGLRYECSSTSKIQVDSWLSALQGKCKLSSYSS